MYIYNDAISHHLCSPQSHRTSWTTASSDLTEQRAAVDPNSSSKDQGPETTNTRCVFVHLSRSVRVLAWITPRSHSARFLRWLACLWPYTSMATAPSDKYSKKSSDTGTENSFGKEERFSSHASAAFAQHAGPCELENVTLVLSKTTVHSGSVGEDEEHGCISGAMNTDSSCPQKWY